MKKLALLTAVALFAITAPAQAAIVVDQSPDVNGLTTGFNASNIATGQNFLLQFTLGSATSLTGAAIYSAISGANLGDGAVFKLWSDAAGAPGGPIVSLLTTLDAIDASGSSANPSLQRLHASFASTALGAGTYWFGLAGVNEIGLELGFGNPGSTGAWQLGGDALSFSFNNNVKSSFQLDNNLGAVPEPASWALMIAGFGLVGSAMRRRRETVRVSFG